MPKIFELYGHRLNDDSVEAESNRSRAWCPFMDASCDGGGNRYLTNIDLSKYSELQKVYPDQDHLVPGVCSIETSEGQSPWIVCPRRLLVLGRQKANERIYQRALEARLLELLDYPSGTRLGIWKEVNVNHVGAHEGVAKKFDYAFDYILMPMVDVSITEAITGDTIADSGDPIPPQTPAQINKKRLYLEKRGFKVTPDKNALGGYVVHNYPQGKPSIIEIMTSSTSGGNKKHRTQIPQAFEDAILGREHNAPSINYRQVWARMASQLLVKSEVALGWGGIAIWVVQDVLVDYISKSTGLNVRDFVRDKIDQVNLLSYSYGNMAALVETGVVDSPVIELFSGSVAPVSRENLEATPSFVDIVRLPIQPPISKLIKLLTDDGPNSRYLVVT